MAHWLRPSHSEAYLKPSQDERFCGNSQHLKAVNYFRRKAPPWLVDWVLNTPLSLASRISISEGGIAEPLDYS